MLTGTVSRSRHVTVIMPYTVVTKKESQLKVLQAKHAVLSEIHKPRTLSAIQLDIGKRIETILAQIKSITE